ncbi:peptidase dimerization domain-containing protein, partial [Streptococcus thermophilus]|nr:peptidase dimerization domain-containing protein [Streptococcus thermophilus]
VMAAVERFEIIVKGQGSHAAFPQEGRDPILASSAIVQNLQQIVSRNISPQKTAVVSITHIESGNTWNVLPNNARLEGTIRTFENEVRTLTKRRFSEIIEATAKAYDVQVEIKWLMEAEPTFNDFDLTEQIRQITEQW